LDCLSNADHSQGFCNPSYCYGRSGSDSYYYNDLDLDPTAAQEFPYSLGAGLTITFSVTIGIALWVGLFLFAVHFRRRFRSQAAEDPVYSLPALSPPPANLMLAPSTPTPTPTPTLAPAPALTPSHPDSDVDVIEMSTLSSWTIYEPPRPGRVDPGPIPVWSRANDKAFRLLGLPRNIGQGEPDSDFFAWPAGLSSEPSSSRAVEICQELVHEPVESQEPDAVDSAAG
jgi:hypothetical protein